MALVHILPEASSEYIVIKLEEGVDTPFPLPYMLVFCGYTLVLIIDKVMFDSHALLEGPDGHGHGHGHGHGNGGHDEEISHNDSENKINKTQISEFDEKS